MGFFGVLSIGFLVSVVVTIMGFFLYTFLSLRARMLHFGVLRAIGLSVRQLVSMLALEQVFSLGLGLIVGSVLGRLISNVFLPFLEQTSGSKRPSRSSPSSLNRMISKRSTRYCCPCSS